jgi:NADH/NAD ratio-sensing transcriptional regulator Rex
VQLKFFSSPDFIVPFQYIDFDRDMMSEFLDNDEPSSSMIVGVGKLGQTMYNLKGELVRAAHATLF